MKLAQKGGNSKLERDDQSGGRVTVVADEPPKEIATSVSQPEIRYRDWEGLIPPAGYTQRTYL